jgi:hypothetical protein
MDRKGDLPVGTQPEAVIPSEKFNVALAGYENVSKKFCDVIMHFIMDFDVVNFKAVNKIVITTEDTKKFGSFDVDTRTVYLNMKRHFESVIKIVKQEEMSTMSFRAHLWFNLLTTTIHELIHAMAYAVDPEKMINGDKKKIEEEVRKETSARLRDFIRDYDSEPPLIDDEPFFSALYVEFYMKHIKDNAEQWAINQNELHNTGFIWKDGDLACNLFREWYRGAYELEGDENWDKDPAPLKSEGVNFRDVDISTEAEEEPAAAPEVEAVAEPEKVEEQPAPVQEEAPPKPPQGYVDPEMMSLLDMDEPVQINMETNAVLFEEPQLPPAAVSPEPPAQPQLEPTPQTPPAAEQELPQKQIPETGRCKSCSAELVQGAKFCFNCGTSVVETPMPVLPQEAPSTPQSVLPTAPVVGQQPMPHVSNARRPMRHDLVNHGHTAEQIRACVGEIFIRCYQHIFGKCGWRPSQNPSFAPELRNAVQEPISVVGIPCVEQILIGMDSVDSMTGNYTWSVPPVNGMIRGKVTKNLGLPSYTLYFNFNGHEAKRLIIPQNQWKATGATYSGPAQRAQQGATIIWLMEGDDTAPGKKWKAKIENGNLEWLI